MECVDAFVGLGSNLGDRAGQLRFAAQRIAAHPSLELVARSRIFETDPIGPPGQGAYLNAALQLRTTLAPEALLEVLHDIERSAGRKREDETVRWGPRRLDLDLLLYGDARRSDAAPRVPHPQLHERAFVLEPLSEIAAELAHPVLGRTIAELAEERRDPAAVRVWAEREAWQP